MVKYQFFSFSIDLYFSGSALKRQIMGLVALGPPPPPRPVPDVAEPWASWAARAFVPGRVVLRLPPSVAPGLVALEAARAETGWIGASSPG